jgi:hypothetical protein
VSRVLSILLLALYGLTLSQAYIPQVNYWMNRDYIAAVLCENKDKPELDCNGKCHLKKQIKEQSESEEEGQEMSERLMIEFVRDIDAFALAMIEIPVENVLCDYCEELKSGITRGVFHPPQLLLL